MSKKTNVRVIDSVDSLGEKKTIVVKYPSGQQLKEAQFVSTKAFKEAMGAGALTRERIDDYMKENGMWNDTKQKEFDGLQDKIRDGERQLARGGKTKDGKPFTKDAAKKLAIEMRGWRFKQLLLLAERRKLDEYTVQGQAETAKFDFLVSQCTFNTEQHPTFTSVEDYLNKAEEPYVQEAAGALANMMYGLDPDFDKNRPENKFLVKFGFAREEDLHLTDKDGNLVSVDGKRVNKDGKYINTDGKLIDLSGNLVDENGDPVEEFVDFPEDADKEKAPVNAS